MHSPVTAAYNKQVYPFGRQLKERFLHIIRGYGLQKGYIGKLGKHLFNSRHGLAACPGVGVYYNPRAKLFIYHLHVMGSCVAI